jgi:hypothetical protein
MEISVPEMPRFPPRTHQESGKLPAGVRHKQKKGLAKTGPFFTLA